MNIAVTDVEGNMTQDIGQGWGAVESNAAEKLDPSQRDLFDFAADLSHANEELLKNTAQHMASARQVYTTPESWATVYGEEPGLSDAVNNLRYRLDAPKNIWGDMESRLRETKESQDQEGTVAGEIFDAVSFPEIIETAERGCIEGGGIFEPAENAEVLDREVMQCTYPVEDADRRPEDDRFAAACKGISGEVAQQVVPVTRDDGSSQYETNAHIDQCIVVAAGIGVVETEMGPQVAACEEAGGSVVRRGENQYRCVVKGEDDAEGTPKYQDFV